MDSRVAVMAVCMESRRVDWLRWTRLRVVKGDLRVQLLWLSLVLVSRMWIARTMRLVLMLLLLLLGMKQGIICHTVWLLPRIQGHSSCNCAIQQHLSILNIRLGRLMLRWKLPWSVGESLRDRRNTRTNMGSARRHGSRGSLERIPHGDWVFVDCASDHPDAEVVVQSVTGTQFLWSTPPLSLLPLWLMLSLAGNGFAALSGRISAQLELVLVHFVENSRLHHPQRS